MNRKCILFFLAPLLASASTITEVTGFTTYDMYGLGVGPVTLSIDGIDHQAIDYTIDYSAQPGDTWSADLTELPTLPFYFNTDPQAALKDATVTWVAQDFTTATTTAQLITDQYAIYGIFAAPGDMLTSTPASVAEAASAALRAAGGPAPGWEFIDSPPGSKQLMQGFVAQVQVGTNIAPEPETLVLIGGGLLAMAVASRKWVASVGK